MQTALLRKKLCDLSAPYSLWHDLDPNENSLIPSFLYKENNRHVVKVRGHKMTSVEELMSEFGASLQFFDDFGENFNALNECLCYLDEWLSFSEIVIVLTRPNLFLIRCNDQDFIAFFTLIQRVGEWWSKPISDNGRFNRPSIPFHIVIQNGYEDEKDKEDAFLKRIQKLNLQEYIRL